MSADQARPPGANRPGITDDEEVLERFWYPLLAEEELVYDPVYSAAQWSGFKPTTVDGVLAGDVQPLGPQR